MVEESVNSAWPFLKVPAGMFLTTTMLSHSSSEKDKDAISSTKSVATAEASSTSSVLEVLDLVLLKEDLVVNAKVTPNLTDADMSILMSIMTAKILMPLITPDSLT